MPSSTLFLKVIMLASMMCRTMANVLEHLPPDASTGARHWQPVLDWDRYTCYNTAAIDQHGNINDGLQDDDDDNRGCHNVNRLQHNNAYVRQRCNRGWCVYLYAYYSENDSGWFGHRHDWEHAQVWTKDQTIQYIRWTSHGDYHRKWVGDARYEGSHLKLVNHLGGAGTTSLRLAESDDDNVENDLGHWEAAWLVDVDSPAFQMFGLRDKLFGHSFDDAHLDLTDGRFEEKIIEAMPDSARAEGFDAAWDDPNGHWW